MRAYASLIILLLSSTTIFAQKNLVLNPGFEIYDTCPRRINDQVNDAKYWTGIDSTGIAVCTPEFFHECAYGSNVGIPFNGKYYQYARSGKGMSQVCMFSDESQTPNGYNRDYLQGRLSNKLTVGKTYCVSYYVCQEEYSRYAIMDFGAYLDNGIIDTAISECGKPKTQFIPQIVYKDSIISDTANWTKVEGSFVATGVEQFITIGNFLSKSATTYTSMPDNGYNGFTWFSLYLVDDVSVIESDAIVDAGPDTHVGFGDSVYIGIPQVVGLDNHWTVLDSQTVIGKGSGIWVKPTTTTSYVVSQTLCGVTKKDTVTVEVWAAGVVPLTKSKKNLAYPNPVTDIAKFDGKLVGSISIYDYTGKVVVRTILSGTAGGNDINVQVLKPGIYYYRIVDKAGQMHAGTLTKIQ
jgi:hypothetical protein